MSPADQARDGWGVIEAAVAAARDRLGAALSSAFAIGSLAHGGFSPAVSDVDLALLTVDELDLAETVDAIGAEVRRRVPGELAQRLSVFHVAWSRFRDPPAVSRFPAIDRQDLVRHGVLVHGKDLRRRYAVAPARAEIVTEAVGWALDHHTPELVAGELEGVLGAGELPVRGASKLVLWPIRLQHVAETGVADGNAAAVAHYRAAAGAGHVELAERALSWRALGRIPDGDEARSRLSAEVIALHREVLHRLSECSGVPRAGELAERGAAFAAAR
jgi:predicted nucleotidyltransferase